MIPDDPALNMRPATSFACGRKPRPIGETPRMTTFDGFFGPCAAQQAVTFEI
jgi:hypothetical protein